MASLKYRFVGLILLISNLLLTSLADDPNQFSCSSSPPHVNVSTGIIKISNTGSCSFIAKDGSKFFGIKTTHLNLSPGDTLKIIAAGGANTTTINGPLEAGYLLVGYDEPTFEFVFDKGDKKRDMQVEFIQDITGHQDQKVPFDCNSKVTRTVRLVGMNSFKASFRKLISDPVHIQVLGDQFGHYLMTGLEYDKFITTSTNMVTLLYEPVLGECSNLFEHAEEKKQYEISGPSTIPDNQYTCVNIFSISTDMKDESAAHFDVDFANFIKLSDSYDELIIDDRKNPLRLGMFGSDDYAKKVLSFSGKNIAVIYTSPGRVNPTNIPFKLTVFPRENGGLVTVDKQLTIPQKGSISYTLVPQAGKVASIELEKIEGVKLNLFDDSNEQITLNENAVLPPVISLDGANKRMYLRLEAAGKSPAGTIKFKSIEANCGGVFYGPEGVMSVSASTKGNDCYWLIGSQKSQIRINYNELGSGACLEIHSLSQSGPIYKGCDLMQEMTLPDFQLDQAYVKLTTPQGKIKFLATISPPAPSLIETRNGIQRNTTSIGFPTSYPWSSQTEIITYDANSTSMLLSVASLDVRKGEKLIINGEEVTKEMSNDIDISNKISQAKLERSLATKDFAFHQGLKLIATQYQHILVADMTQNTIDIPKDLNSALIKVKAESMKRLNYSLTITSSEKDYELSVIDSRTILGRKVYGEEKMEGSTTSDTLLVSVVATKKDAKIPTLTLQYKQLVCNVKEDHVCDNESRCVPASKLCKGKVYCRDQSDMKVICSDGPAPEPKVVNKGFSGATVFVLCLFMLAIGAVGALYGPLMYKNVEGRFRTGRYTTFSSTE